MTTLKSKIQTTAICSFVVGSALQAGAANLVSNGDFELYTGGSAFQSSSPGSFPSQMNDAGTGGYTKLTDWTTGPGNTGLLSFLLDPATAATTGSRDIRFNDNFSLWSQSASPAGGLYVGLDAASSFRGVGISQTINGLVPGDTYEVEFYWAAAQQFGFDGDTTEQVQVTLGGAPAQLTSVFNLPSHGFSGWMHETFGFTADSTSAVLNFLSLGGPDGLPPFVLLDGVSVNSTNSVPDSGSTVGLLGLGIAAMGAVAIRSRRRE
ncbi:MAG TPA: VPDSG-CTERM sorting domain-containing protein [Verrucomicrobiota bacterium]|nr:hypothetical protein [Verrucomicrobiales bacterium]HRI14072.1 VPDSG-CTERM sorting domain-containing protein [Verrucomicrobiota bacterium]